MEHSCYISFLDFCVISFVLVEFSSKLVLTRAVATDHTEVVPSGIWRGDVIWFKYGNNGTHFQSHPVDIYSLLLDC